MDTCAVPHCHEKARTRGWCNAHYQRWLRHGDPLSGGIAHVRGDDIARFWTKVNQDGSLPNNRPELGRCWQWIGTRTNSGRSGPTVWWYGVFGTGPANDHRKHRAHRYAYELLVGPIPDGKQLDHLCENTLCVNPRHLEAVSNHENTARGRAAEVNRNRQLAKTHCKRGHEFTPENTLYSCGQRICRECNRIRARLYNKGLRIKES